MVSPRVTCQGEKGSRYRLVRPLGTQIRGKRPNVWLAVDDCNDTAEYVVKQPPDDETNIGDSLSDALLAFKHELKMQRLFEKDSMIQKLVDFVPDSEPGGPMMVLEAFTDSLWEARNARPFSTKEIKWIVKSVLLGIYTVHMKGLVYTDLKMENVALGGFDHAKPSENIRELIVRLADCGSITKSSTTEVTSLTYRSPEVHFGKSWTQSTDVWSWGIILAQLLQAKVDLKSLGMYDSISTGTLEEKTKAVRDQLAIDFDLASIPFYAEDKECAKKLPSPQPEEAYMWANEMVEKGVAGEDIQFLVEVLNPDPNARLTVPEILESGYLEC
ncbi:CMGC protein kinase [Blastomyces parvus]|uniref:CMGC protein kinase n=1 Tax=Blastomyces parvus TaxID=2060905 RepID=A0A2B7WPN7_9EURO|nr:CMGC protein kinase [Blastomyces parvus]